MGDLTYEGLMTARKVKAETTQEFDLVGMAKLALGILTEVNKIKGNVPAGNMARRGNIAQPDNIIQSRPENESTGGVKSNMPQIDVKQILEALKTVKQLKGDIKITELETLLNEHKDQIEMLLGKL